MNRVYRELEFFITYEHDTYYAYYNNGDLITLSENLKINDFIKKVRKIIN